MPDRHLLETQITGRVSQDLYDWVQEYSLKMNVSMGWVLAKALYDFRARAIPPDEIEYTR